MRSNIKSTMLVVANFDRDKNFSATIHLPENIMHRYHYKAIDLLMKQQLNVGDNGLHLQISSSDVVILKLM